MTVDDTLVSQLADLGRQSASVDLKIIGQLLAVGLGGMLGLVAGLVQWLPLAVLAPIIVYVAIDITTHAFQATPKRHAGAMVLGFLPSVAYLLAIKAPVFDAVPTVIAQFFPRIVITLQPLLQKIRKGA